MDRTLHRISPPNMNGYQYQGLLGRGGFADVFEYHQTDLRRDVAVKVGRKEPGTDLDGIFAAEARAMAILSDHPSVVPLYSTGSTSDGRPILVLQACLPGPLSTARMRPSVSRLLEVGVQIAAAIESAHRMGILHGDIKPSNILTTRYGQVALSDFGASAELSSRRADRFSLPWAAPEQVRESVIIPQSDVYCLAATLWAGLAGRSPFSDRTINNDGTRKLSASSAQSLTSDRPDVPLALAELLFRSMSSDVSRRPESALDLVRSLQAIEDEIGLAVTRAVIWKPPATPEEARSASASRTKDLDATDVGSKRVRADGWESISPSLIQGDVTGVGPPMMGWPPMDTAATAVEVLSTLGGVAGGIGSLRAAFSYTRGKMLKRQAKLNLDDTVRACTDSIERTFGLTMSGKPHRISVDGDKFTIVWRGSGQEYLAEGQLKDPVRRVRLTTRTFNVAESDLSI